MSMTDILKQPTRIVKTRAIFGNLLCDEDTIVEWTYDGAINGIYAPSFGNSYSASITIRLLKNEGMPDNWLEFPLLVQAGICSQEGVTDPEQATEFYWYNIGYFYLDESTIVEDKLSIQITGFDWINETTDIKYETELTFPATVSQVVDEMKTRYGISAVQLSNPMKQLEYKPKGSLRDALQALALYTGCNVIALPSAEKILKFVFAKNHATAFEITGDNYQTLNIQGNGISTISKLSAYDYEAGDDTGATFYLENTCISEGRTLDDFYTTAQLPITWQAYTLLCQGFPNLIGNIGQNIEVTTPENNTYTLPMSHHTMHYSSGGLKSTFSCDAIDESAGLTASYGLWYISGRVEEIDGIEYDYENIQGQIDDLEDSTNSSINSLGNRVTAAENSVAEIGPITAYVKVVTADDGTKYLLIGNSSSPMKTKMTNEELQFLNGDVKVAYVSQDTLQIKNANIQENLTFGNWQWKEELDGRLTLKYVG